MSLMEPNIFFRSKFRSRDSGVKMSRKNKDELVKQLDATKVGKRSLCGKRNIYVYTDEDVADFLNIELQTLRDLKTANKINPSSFNSIFSRKDQKENS